MGTPVTPMLSYFLLARIVNFVLPQTRGIVFTQRNKKGTDELCFNWEASELI